MNSGRRSAYRSLSFGWAATILLVWLAISVHFDQPVWARQHSRDLARYGAIRGSDFELADSWRLLASQWLHVNMPHMAFNALIIALVGWTIERRHGWPLVAATGLIGGALAQLATLYVMPEAYISGASQAYLALCGLALLIVRPRLLGWWTAMLGVATAFCLDLFVSSHGAIKVGHIVGVVAGLLAGLIVVAAKTRSGRSGEAARG